MNCSKSSEVDANGESVLDVAELGIAQLQKGYAQGGFSAEAIVRAHLDRIARYEPNYNAFTFLNPSAVGDAKAIDRRREAGEALGALAGIPVVVKETMDVVGLPSTFGWARLSSKLGGIDLMPERDAPVVSRLRAAGAVILGKTNVPAFCNDGARANSSWDGPTYNAVDRSVAPGASSTGTATAVAASFAVAGLATETGGSIQNPAAAQSLVGVVPTFGLIPNTGVQPMGGSTRDVVGPCARTAIDAAILLDAIAGYSVEDEKTRVSIGRLPIGGYAAALRADALAGVRLGLYGTGWRSQALSSETEALYDAAKSDLRACCATLIDDPFADSGFADLAQGGAWDARGLESMPYDLENYLHRLGPTAAVQSLSDLRCLGPEDPFSPKGILGSYVKSVPLLSEALEDPGTLSDLSSFFSLRQHYNAIFETVMNRRNLLALAFPQSFAALPGLFDQAKYPSTLVSEINIAGLPAVTVPAGRYANGSPFSLIFVGRVWSEGTLLSLAHAYEQANSRRIVPNLVDSVA